MALNLTKENVRSAFGKERERTQGEITQLEKEILTLQEEYNAPTPDYIESQDLQLMRDLAVAARDEMQAPVISNIAAQLAMVRNPAFERQWQDVTRRRVNAAREYFQRQGLVARQAATEEEAFRRYNKRDPRRLLEAKRSLERARSRLSESPVKEAGVLAGIDKARMAGDSRQAIAAMRTRDPIDLDERIQQLRRNSQNIQRITRTTNADVQSRLIARFVPEFAGRNMSNASVREAVLADLREQLKSQQRDLAVLQSMKKANKGAFVKDADEYNRLEARARKGLRRGRKSGSSPRSQTGGRQQRIDRREALRIEEDKKDN